MIIKNSNNDDHDNQNYDNNEYKNKTVQQQS